MKIYDISWPLSAQTTQYKNRTIITFESRKTFEKDKARETIITIDTHAGTHVDAPAHFLEHGKTIDQIPLEQLIGQALVLDLTRIEEKITEQDLAQHEHQLNSNIIVLCKTKNSFLSPTDPFNPNSVYIDSSAAAFLADTKIKAIGIDYLGIERNQPNHETHNLFLEHNIPIIEGLRLNHITPSTYFFICLPLLATGLDGAPSRAILIENNPKLN